MATISASVRLLIVLLFLATCDSLESLMYLFKVTDSTLSRFSIIFEITLFMIPKNFMISIILYKVYSLFA
nr:unnamed protein product [Callosobruchus chinensis]